MKDAEWEKVEWEKYRSDLEKSFTFPTGGNDPEVTPQDTSSKPVMIGFKLMYDQIPQHLRLQFAHWLQDNNVHVVHLRRRCAALQWASQMDKYMQQYRNKNKKDHVYSKAEAEALAATKNWEITMEDGQQQPNRWLQNVKLLEANQEDFARYLHVHAAKSPVFELAYENVDGPFQENWFNALFSFLGFDFRYSKSASKTIKTGSRQCEDRIAGLGGPPLPLLDNTNSQTECLRMRALALGSNYTAGVLPSLGSLLMPPRDGRCRLGPNCQQREYGLFQDQLLKQSKG
jgi:hypothetical protein